MSALLVNHNQYSNTNTNDTNDTSRPYYSNNYTSYNNLESSPLQNASIQKPPSPKLMPTNNWPSSYAAVGGPQSDAAQYRSTVTNGTTSGYHQYAPSATTLSYTTPGVIPTTTMSEQQAPNAATTTSYQPIMAATVAGGRTQVLTSNNNNNTSYVIPTPPPRYEVQQQSSAVGGLVVPSNNYQYASSSAAAPRTVTYSGYGTATATTTVVQQDYSDAQLYRPDGAMYVTPGGVLRGGMNPLYNMAEVRTYEALPIFTSPATDVTQHQHHHQHQQGVSCHMMAGGGEQQHRCAAHHLERGCAGQQQTTTTTAAAASEVSSLATSHLKKVHHKHQAKQRFCC